MAGVTSTERTFVPAMGKDWLLPVYDPVTRLLGVNRTRPDLVAAARLEPGHRALDVGCGTGTLALLIKQLHPGVEVVGLDPDPKALARAERKARLAGLTVRFQRGFCDALPYPDAAFDRVFSSFMFHHLDRELKARMLLECRRVLSPGGRLHLVDFVGHEPSARRHSPGSHGQGWMADNAESIVLGMIRAAGFARPTKAAERRLLGGVFRVGHYVGAADRAEQSAGA